MNSLRLAFKITDESRIGETRRAAFSLAEDLGFDAPARGRVGIAATEAASNIYKHARDGEIVLAALKRGDAPAGIELLALDKGPGMADVSACLQDGFSTAQTAGTGLGAISRLASEFAIYSLLGVGTALQARFWQTHPVQPWPADGIAVGAVCRPVANETECGDAWSFVRERAGRDLCVVADGLGHGASAADASRAAIEAFHLNAALGLTDILRAIHAALRKTRGAAGAVVDLRLAENEIRFAGVGNISGTIIAADGATRSVLSHNGTLGHEARKFQELPYPFPPGAALLLHSDGMTANWSLAAYPGLLTRSPGLLAGVLYRDFHRPRDDATVVVLRATVKE